MLAIQVDLCIETNILFSFACIIGYYAAKLISSSLGQKMLGSLNKCHQILEKWYQQTKRGQEVPCTIDDLYPEQNQLINKVVYTAKESTHEEKSIY